MEITCPRVVKLKLIPTAYFNLSPVAPVLLCLSLPAKSTKFITEIFYVFVPPTDFLCLN
jgi:hypothetical protein